MRKSAVIFLLCVSLLTTCARSTSTPLNVYDGFESPKLSELWDTSRFAPGAVAIQTSIVRAGHSALRITLKPHDVFGVGRNGNQDSERDEILEKRRLFSRETIPYEFFWSMYLPPDFPIVPVRLVVAQWKQDCGGDSAPCSDDSPVLAVRYIGGFLRVTQDISHKRTVLYEAKRDLRGSWLDLRFRVRFTPQNTGRVQTWLDGRQVIDYRGVTANSESTATGYPNPGYFYFKMGLYRDVMPQPMTIYLDEYRKREIQENQQP
jgi:hypothetical protein